MKASEWPRSKLDDLTEKDRSITYGVVKPGDHDVNGVRFIRGGDVLNGKINIAALRTITQEISQQYKRTLLRGGELLVSLVGNPGEVAIAPNSLNGANIARQVGLIALNHTVHAPYVMYFLISDSGRRELFAQTTGSVQKVINLADLKNVRVPLPPLPIQCKIAAVLSAYDDLIENNTRRIAILEEMAQAIYREWFVNFRFPGHEKVKLINSPLGKIPEGWKPHRLGEIAKEVRRGVDPSQVDPDTPYIGLEHLPRRSITLGEWGKAADVQSTKLAFKKGEILFGKICPYFHKVGVAPVDGVCSSDAIVIVPTSASAFGPVVCCVSSDDFVRHATQTSQGTIMPRANWDVLVNYPLPIPPDGLLHNFNEIISDTAATLRLLMLKNRNLRATRDLLLPKLISGQLDVEDLDIETGENAVADASGSDLVCSEAVREGAGRSEPQASTPPRKKQS